MTAAPPDHDVLWARDLHCTRQGMPALQGVSLTVRDGEVLAVAGPRGSGKSTLLNCLSGTQSCTGEVWFGDIPLLSLPGHARERLRRERFGWVGHRPQLLPELTAWENAALPLLVNGMSPRQARRVAMEWLERLDVGASARRRPSALRHAQQQRVAIARSLAAGPSVLFADEPAAPLHSLERLQALRTLVAAARSLGVTTILTGAEAEVTGLADRTVTLLDGRLEGSSASLPSGSACSVSV